VDRHSALGLAGSATSPENDPTNAAEAVPVPLQNVSPAGFIPGVNLSQVRRQELSLFVPVITHAIPASSAFSVIYGRS
jgi:hypothetical protein